MYVHLYRCISARSISSHVTCSALRPPRCLFVFVCHDVCGCGWVQSRDLQREWSALVQVNLCVCMYMYISIHVCMYVYIYIYIDIYRYIYTYTYIHTHPYTHTRTDCIDAVAGGVGGGAGEGPDGSDRGRAHSLQRPLPRPAPALPSPLHSGVAPPQLCGCFGISGALRPNSSYVGGPTKPGGNTPGVVSASNFRACWLATETSKKSCLADAFDENEAVPDGPHARRRRGGGHVLLR